MDGWMDGIVLLLLLALDLDIGLARDLDLDLDLGLGLARDLDLDLVPPSQPPPWCSLGGVFALHGDINKPGNLFPA
jgi:hypothetical protein